MRAERPPRARALERDACLMARDAHVLGRDARVPNAGAFAASHQSNGALGARPSRKPQVT